jgi:putative peptidoglycan lipid II flippase
MPAIPIIESKQQSLLRSTSLVSIMTLLSRLMGFARDMVLAYFFGTEAGMDAFFVAFRIPNFMRRLFAEGAFSQAFVPVLAEYQKTKPIDEVRLFIARIAGSLSFVLSLVTIIGIIATPLIVYLFAPGFGHESLRTVLATEMLRITFPFLMFVSLTAMCGALLNTYGYFGVPAFTPIFLNVCMILAALYLSPHVNPPVVALAWGVLIAGIVQFIFQLPFLTQRRLLVKPQLSFKDPGVTKVLKLMVPALFGVSIAQLNLMIDSIFASFLQEGSVSWLYFTDRLTDFPLGVFGVAIATVILPHLSRQNAKAHREQFSRALDWGLRSLLLIGVPSGLGLALFSMPLITTSFAYGHFVAADILQTQKSLITLSLGVPAFMMIKVLASGFYARQDIKTPVKIGAIAMVINSLLCACLILPLAHAGLTLASTLAGYLNCGLLLRLLIRKKIYQPVSGWRLFLAQLCVASTLMAIFLKLVTFDLQFWINKSISMRAFYILIDITIAMLIYFSTLKICGLKANDFRGHFKDK